MPQYSHVLGIEDSLTLLSVNRQEILNHSSNLPRQRSQSTVTYHNSQPHMHENTEKLSKASISEGVSYSNKGFGKRLEQLIEDLDKLKREIKEREAKQLEREIQMKDMLISDESDLIETEEIQYQVGTEDASDLPTSPNFIRIKPVSVKLEQVEPESPKLPVNCCMKLSECVLL